MRINLKTFIWSIILLPAALGITPIPSACAQTISGASTEAQVARASNGNSEKNNGATKSLPVFTNYRGISIGMSAQEVRAKLDSVKEGKAQDFLVYSDKESAQIYYDKNQKVMAISVDYFDKSNAPSSNAVLGLDLQSKPDGSMYQLNRYPKAGYWVSYNRTAGDKPIVTITMQKL